MKRKSIIVLMLLAATISFMTYDGGRLLLSATTRDTYEKLRAFSDVIGLIQSNYVEEVDLEKIIYDSIKGMVTNLDPHSSFMPPDMYKEMQVETKGKFGGLGIEITIKDNVLTVVSPIEDTPAHRAGILTGDRIIKIEDASTKDMSLLDAVKIMRGAPDTDHRLPGNRQGGRQRP